jgi:hypothetical protein
MKQTQKPLSKPLQALRKLALGYPEAEEGIACAGTSLEKRTIKARNKAFLFLGVSDLMLKLGDSVPEATSLAAKNPACCKVGASGWVTVSIGPDASPTLDVLERWVDESYRRLAPKQLVAMLPERGLKSADTKKTAKKKNAKKKSKID